MKWRDHSVFNLKLKLNIIIFDIKKLFDMTNYTVTIGQICLANVQRDESNSTYRYGNRHKYFLELFGEFKNNSDIRPDIISIKEVRKCKSQGSDNLLLPNDIVIDLARTGDYSIASLDSVKLHNTKNIPTYIPFFLAQLYNHHKYEKINTYCFRYYDKIFGDSSNPPHMGGSLLACLYAPRDENGCPILDKQFLIESCHFPLSSEHKMKVIKWLNEDYLIERKRIFGDIFDKHTIIRTGDFNLFKDDLLFDQQKELLTLDYNEVTTPNLKDEFGNKMYGTFYPFPSDTPANGVVIAKPTENVNNTSALDYMFLSKNTQAKLLDCTLITKTFNPTNKGEKITYDEKVVPLSDHLPLICKFSL